MISSYRHRQDVPVRHDGKMLGWARFHPITSAEARKHRANVRIDRAEPGGPRVVCWVRQNEAKAVVEAARNRQDSPVEDRDGSPEGMVQYFAPGSAAANRYRSVTRLLRLIAQGGSTQRLSAEAVTGRPPARQAPSRAELEGRELEAVFHAAMVKTYERARDEANYNAGLLLRMVTAKGGLATARQLLANPAVSDGFTALWERGRVDLTAEAVVLHPQFRSLFTAEELAVASSRVADASSNHS